MLIYPSPKCSDIESWAAHLCDECYVEYILPGSLDVVLTTWATYKMIMAS